MCDDKLLNQLKHLQVTPRKICCTASSACWCSKVSYKFEIQSEKCMSPVEMLEVAGRDMNFQDVEYLKTLALYEFDPREP
jgi:hypothetical protein